MEGRNREVRRLWESQGVKVNRLKRVRFGPVFLPSKAKVGRWVEMDDTDVQSLCEVVGLEHKVSGPKSQQEKHDRRRQSGARVSGSVAKTKRRDKGFDWQASEKQQEFKPRRPGRRSFR